MRQKLHFVTGIAAAAGMLAMILDAETALHGAAAGVDLCIKTVIPSLFPFFILSILLTGAVTGSQSFILRPIGKLCGIPPGAESILLVGLLGGYPVGAKCIGQAYSSGQLSSLDARRMLGFCNNAGPAFIFGMAGSLMASRTATLALWIIHIVSALLTAMLLPREKCDRSSPIPAKRITLGQALEQSIHVMATVCGWVVVFRVIVSFLQHWVTWMLPPQTQIIFSGFLELSNGCMDLLKISYAHVRFVLAAVFISFGGICVCLQTVSVAGQAGVDMGYYFPGKLLQTSLTGLLAIPAANLLFSDSQNIAYRFLLIPAMIAVTVLVFLQRRKNNSSIPAITGV